MAGYAFRMIEGRQDAFIPQVSLTKWIPIIDLGWERPNRSYEGLPEKMRTAELCTYWAAYTWDKYAFPLLTPWGATLTNGMR